VTSGGIWYNSRLLYNIWYHRRDGFPPDTPALQQAETWAWTKADISRLKATEATFLSSIQGKTKREKLKSEKIKDNLKKNTLEGKLTNNRIRQYGH
jgi:hypothetical protein